MGHLRYRIAEQQPHWYGSDFYKGYSGLNEIIYCTPAHLRAVLRRVWEAKRDSNVDPYLMIHTKSDNTRYEGIKIDGWVSGDDKDAVNCFQGQQSYQFAIADIIALDISY